MANWTFNENEYNERAFSPIPEGDHRVRITNVEEKVFSTGNEGFEISLDVNGHNSKLWYYLSLDPKDSAKTNQRIGMFFNSFGITDYDLDNWYMWVGKEGAVRVRHNTYNGKLSAQVAFCLNRKQQDKLPGWIEKATDMMTRVDKQLNVPPTAKIPPREFNGFSF